MTDISGSFFDPRLVKGLASRIRETVERRIGRQVTIMEVCGTHTHTIGRAGLRPMLAPYVRLVSGPGCPVCVTPVDYLDVAVALAIQSGACVCTFGDLLRVPSSTTTLERVSAEGGDVRVVYSPLEALEIAAESPAKTVVFLSIGFETTTPGIAAALLREEELGIKNFMLLVGNKLIPPALRALLSDPGTKLDGLILPGHVSVITGSDVYAFIAEEFRVPAVVAGFTPADVLQAVLRIVEDMAAGEPKLSNVYSRAVTKDGNRVAREAMFRVFSEASASWRGLGEIPGSGLKLRDRFSWADAASVEVELPPPVEPPGCRCPDVLRGLIDPPQCPLFAKRCTPENPVGACMVSSEGSCAAWYRHEALDLGEAGASVF